MRDVGERVLDVVLVVEDLGTEVGLDEEVAGRQEPREGEEVGGEGLRQDVEADRTAF